MQNKFLTKNQLTRQNQKEAKNYLNNVLKRLILSGIQNHIETKEMPLTWQLIDNNNVFKLVMMETLQNQLEIFKKLNDENDL